MKKTLAKLALAAMTCLAAATAFAATSASFNVLCIERTDGVQERLLLDADLKVSLSAEGNIVMDHPKITVIYNRDEVSHFTFDQETNPKLYVGDHESSITTPEAPERTIRITAEGITASGPGAIVLYDLKGVEIDRAESNGSSATLRTSGQAHGVYIVHTGSTTLKIRL